MTMPLGPHARPGWARSAGATMLLASSLSATGTGCADVLGLDGLSFDQSAESQDTASPGDGGGGTGGGEPKLVNPATGGVGGELPTQDEVWGFPAKWSDAIIVAAQLPPSSEPRSPEDEATSSFHVYEPATGLLTSRRFREDGYDEVVSSWSPGFTIVMPRPSTEGLGIFGYDADAPRGEFAAPWDPWSEPENDASARTITAKVNHEVNSGRTHLLTLRHAGSWLLVSHVQDTGYYRVGPAVTNGSGGDPTSTLIRKWEPGWSTLLPYDLGGGEHGLLKASLDTGAVELDVFSEDLALEPIAEANWQNQPWFADTAEGWTHALTFMAGGAPALLLYDSRSGYALRGRLDEELTFTADEDSPWADGWTSLTLVEWNGQSYVLAHDMNGGRARLLSLEPLERPLDPIVR